MTVAQIKELIEEHHEYLKERLHEDMRLFVMSSELEDYKKTLASEYFRGRTEILRSEVKFLRALMELLEYGEFPELTPEIKTEKETTSA